MTTENAAPTAAPERASPPITISDRDHALLSRYLELADGEVAPLEEELARAEVVSIDHLPSDVVRMGSRVTFEDARSGVRRVVTLVYPEEGNASEGRVSVLAPIGAALIGMRVGHAIDCDLPNRRRARLVVVALAQPER